MSEKIKARIEQAGPKRILTLSGGGTRGIITIAFLEEIEKILKERSGKGDEFRLSDYYDLISGTSVGSMLATLLAKGETVAYVKERFEDWAPKIFRKPFWRIGGLAPKFNERQLTKRIQEELQDLTLDSDELKTGLAIMMKRLDTGSPWILTNNPNSKYWNDPVNNPETGKPDFIGNKSYKLSNLVRASTAAPYYFAHKSFEVVQGEKPGAFIDGGVSPHNNPALQSLMLAGIKGYGFNWPLGPDNLMITSIGTGRYRNKYDAAKIDKRVAGLMAIDALQGLINDNETMVLTLLQWLSNPNQSWPINSEIGDLNGECLSDHIEPGKSLLSFQHYDVVLEKEWLKETLGLDVSDEKIKELREFDNPKNLNLAFDLAKEAVSRQVQADDFAARFDVKQAK